MNYIRLLQRNLTSSRFDAKTGQIACWAISMIVMVGGVYKITLMRLTEAEFFLGLLLVVSLSLLGIVMGLLLPISQHVAEQQERE